MIKFDKQMLEVRGYKIRERRPEHIERIWRNMKTFNLPLPIFRENKVIYSGAEHAGKPKLPNITILPNIIHYPNGFLMGSTFGHQHTQYQRGDRRPFQELYEFKSYGAMLVRKNSDAHLFLMSPGSKVTIKPDENMTLFNMGDSPLTTTDYANPEMNSATKELEEEIGPLMAIWKTDSDITFRINPLYHQRGLLNGERTNISIQTKQREATLFGEMLKKRTQFYEAGIILALPERIPSFEMPLEKLVEEKNEDLFGSLQIK